MIRHVLGMKFVLLKLTTVCSSLIILLTVSVAIADDAKVLNIFLIQNSGWMEPFYFDNNSKFKNIVKAVIEKVNHSGDEVVIASFNQSIGENRSPSLAYRGSEPVEIIKALQDIKLVKKPGTSAYADTDFKEAVINSITEYSPARPCILWIFTNNKNSPQNSPETAAKNREFYRWLQGEVVLVLRTGNRDS